MKIQKVKIHKNNYGQIHKTDLTDKEWEIIKDYLPFPAKTGRPRENDRKVLNGVLYLLSTDIRWQDMPKYYPSGTTCWRRMKEFDRLGVWKDINNDVQNKIIRSNKLQIFSKLYKK
jgi:transposase